MGNIAPYQRALAGAQAKLKLLLLSGRGSASDLAVRRKQTEIMDYELSTAPSSVLVWDKYGDDPRTGATPAQRWDLAAYKKANEALFPQYGTPTRYAQKKMEYIDLGVEMLGWGRMRPEVIKDKQAGVQYLILGEDPLVSKIMKVLASELMRWFDLQPNDRDLIQWPTKLGLGRMLRERPDLAMLLRIAQTLPPLVEKSNIPIDRPAMVTVLETAISIIPVVGSAVAAYEAWAGEDLFGYKLSDVERGILAASVLLPIAGRVAKGGRAVYSQARLTRLYGQDAKIWARTIQAGSTGMAQRRALTAIDKAQRGIRQSRGVIRGTIASEGAAAVKSLATGSATIKAVDQEVVELLGKIQASHPKLNSLDAQALERVLEKGPNVDHLKGQLLEEVMESRLVPWLQKREGSFALGIDVPAGKKLEFVPGHLVRDASGRQISDGLLVYREGEALVMAAVFEAKAGKSAARELSYKGGGKSSITKAEKLEFRAAVKDAWRDQRDEAVAAGENFTKSLNQVEKEFVHSELGGQVRRDIERLGGGVGGPDKIRIGAETFEVQLSPTKTKFFGVVPRDVRTANIEKQLTKGGFNYEILGVDLSAKELKSIAGELKDLAAEIAERAP
jgi:hypothetical protein